MKKYSITREDMDSIQTLYSSSTWTKASLLLEHELDNNWDQSTEKVSEALTGMALDKLAAILFIPELVDIVETPEQQLDTLYLDMGFSSEDAYNAYQFGLEKAAKVFGFIRDTDGFKKTEEGEFSGQNQNI